MNLQKVREILKEYKRHFEYIHNDEIYKWQAVKYFKINWNINKPDFLTMLDKSLSLSGNLLASGNYFPKRMLLKYAEVEPETVRELLANLYEEREDLISRIQAFRAGIQSIHKKYFLDTTDYQDSRAILVYLSLRYPDRYYLYKYEMFRDFAGLVDFPYKPKKGAIQNILEYLSLCDLVRSEIIKDSELLKLHQTRIKEDEYLDSDYHILTQDVIYAAVRHIKDLDEVQKQESVLKRLINVNRSIVAKEAKVVLKGSFTNHIENEKEKKRIGELGELLVLQYEQERLNSFGINKSPEHKSKSDGDGLGYDILSYDKDGKELFIEVKTTVYSSETPFYITSNELERSRQDSPMFLLYRLYEFDDTTNSAKFFIQKGDLTCLCNNPIVYKAVIGG